jgi:hypothetical protein
MFTNKTQVVVGIIRDLLYRIRMNEGLKEFFDIRQAFDAAMV